MPEEVAHTERVPNQTQRRARVRALEIANDETPLEEITVAARARQRAAMAREIAAERQSGTNFEALRLNEGEIPAEDPAFANRREKDRYFFNLEVGRIRDCLGRMKIQAVDEPYIFTHANPWVLRSDMGALPRNEGALRLGRSPRAVKIGVRFTTRRPVPSHTARGVRRLPVLVFCIPSLKRDPDAFVETLPRPRYHKIKETDDRCHICHEPFPMDGSSIVAGPGNEWLQEGRPEIPVELPDCGHVMGSNCLAQWYQLPNHNSCPLCRNPIVELTGADSDIYSPLRPDVMDQLFKLGRKMAEGAMISGFEFSYGCRETPHPEVLELRVVRDL